MTKESPSPLPQSPLLRIPKSDVRTRSQVGEVTHPQSHSGSATMATQLGTELPSGPQAASAY